MATAGEGNRTGARWLECLAWLLGPPILVLVSMSVAAPFPEPIGTVLRYTGIVAFVAGAWFLRQPSRRLHIGRWRAAGLLYLSACLIIGALSVAGAPIVDSSG